MNEKKSKTRKHQHRVWQMHTYTQPSMLFELISGRGMVGAGLGLSLNNLSDGQQALFLLPPFLVSYRGRGTSRRLPTSRLGLWWLWWRRRERRGGLAIRCWFPRVLVHGSRTWTGRPSVSIHALAVRCTPRIHLGAILTTRVFQFISAFSRKFGIFSICSREKPKNSNQPRKMTS